MNTKLNIYLFLIIGVFALIGCSNKSCNDGFYSDGTEQYNEIVENPFVSTAEQPVSTFSIDVDGGSYANCRRMINDGYLPTSNAIRTEEFINYFQYNYGEPDDGLPFFHNAEIAQCPWQTEHKLLRIGFKGKTMPDDERTGSNFVFLIDVSGSMDSDDKLELLKECFIYFVEQKIDYRDKVAIVAYYGESEVVLEPTSGDDKNKIIRKIESLKAGGSTNGESAINMAYDLAFENYIENGNNRIILGTDGDFNVGISTQEELIELIEQKRDLGIFITVIGVGQGNIQEGTMEQIADHGNGNYEYIDNLEQGKKVFVNEFNSFYPVAKDVKVQVIFDSTVVKSYRLIGYENRLIENQDFENDSSDAGDLGSDQDVTALYELEMHNGVLNNQKVLNVAVRYKHPNENNSRTFNLDVFNTNLTFEQASENFRFASAIVAFALIMRNSQYVGNANYDDVITWVQNASSYNPYSYKTELIELINKVKNLE